MAYGQRQVRAAVIPVNTNTSKSAQSTSNAQNTSAQPAASSSIQTYDANTPQVQHALSSVDSFNVFGGITEQQASSALNDASKNLGSIMDIFAQEGESLASGVKAELLNELASRLQNGASGNISDISSWAEDFASRYNLGDSEKNYIQHALGGISNNNTLSIYDVGRAVTAYALLSNSGADKLTPDNMSKIMNAEWDNRSDYSAMADKISEIGINYSKNDIIKILNAGDKDKDGALEQSEQMSTGIKALQYSAASEITSEVSSLYAQLGTDRALEDSEVLRLLDEIRKAEKREEELTAGLPEEEEYDSAENGGDEAVSINERASQLLINAGKKMAPLFNIFAVSGGKEEIPAGILSRLMIQLADEGSSLALNFKTGQGRAWIDVHFPDLSSGVRDSIEAALKGIANTKPDNTLTMHDIGNAQYASAILGSYSLTAENIRIIQTIIDDNRFSNTNNAAAARQIFEALSNAGAAIDFTEDEILVILNAGDANKDGRLYDNQITNGISALRSSIAS